MSFLAPIALALSLLAVPIILMYVLKLRRQERVVPSTFLWRQALEDIQANAPWQRLRFNILLLLQLLALAAVILSLARPVYSRSHVIAGDLIVLVDESYGMQAHDVSPSRFAVAVRNAHSLASELSSGHVVSVIGMGAHPSLAVAESSDQGAVGRAIDSLHVGVDQPNFLEALSLAASLARAGQSTRAVVLTSRDSGISSLPLQVTFPVDIVRVGGRLHDLGITAFSASQGQSAVEAVARVSNFGSQTARSDLELVTDGRLADVRPLTVGAHQAQNLFWSDIPNGTQRLQVRLTQPDNVATDKSAWAAVPAAVTRRVLLVSRGDFFLQAALLDDPSVNLTTISPSGYVPGIERTFDLTVFDGVLPRALPTTSALVVSPPAGQMGPLRFRGTAPAGGVTQTSSGIVGPQASLLRYVDLGDVHVALTRSVSLPGWLQPIALSGGRPLLAAGEPPGGSRAGSRTSLFALLSFSLERSDWPLRISFPIMLQNLLHYLAPGLTLGQTTVTTGQAVTFFPPPGTRTLAVTRPDRSVVSLRPPFPPFTDTSRPGLYTVRAVTQGTGAPPITAGTQPQSFAVNFFPARPAPASGPSTVHLGHAQTGKPLIASVPISIAWTFILVALVILGLEWWVALRGIRPA